MKWLVMIFIIMLILMNPEAQFMAGNAFASTLGGISHTLFAPNENGKTLFGTLLLIGVFVWAFGGFKKKEEKKEVKKEEKKEEKK